MVCTEQAEHVAKFNIVTNEIQVYKFRYHKQSLNGMFQYSDSFVFNINIYVWFQEIQMLWLLLIWKREKKK